MTMQRRLASILSAGLLVPGVCCGDKLKDVVDSVDRRDRQLQASFSQFPLLACSTNAPAKLDFHTIALEQPVVIDGVNFYGFRFRVPKRKAQEDLVWTFVEPGPRHFWYIVPQTGSMAGFEDFFREARSAYGDYYHLFPVQASKVVLQRLAASAFEDEHEYAIWFAFGAQKPLRISVALTFASLPSGKAGRGALEKALGLHRK